MTRKIALFFVLLGLVGGPAARADDALTSFVDPFIGTLGAGFVYPGASAPYGMVQLSPDTEGMFAYTGYQYMDSRVRGFSHVHVEAMGVPEGGNVPFMPTLGDIQTDVMKYETPFSHAAEHASPGYYGVTLGNGIEAELTAGERVGMHRYTFPAGPAGVSANLLIDPGTQTGNGAEFPSGPNGPFAESAPTVSDAAVDIVDSRTVTGETIDNQTKPYHVYFAARFDRDFARQGVWSAHAAPAAPCATPCHAGGPNGGMSHGAGAYVSFDTSSDADVRVKVGISFVSVANAVGNLDAELPGGDFDFNALHARTQASWEDALSSIKVDGGTIADKRSFYTALYHAQQHPNVFDDVNGDYIGHDWAMHHIGDAGQPIPAGSHYYANFSLWDTYRGEMQLLGLIAPNRFADMMRSLVAIARQGGRLPKWALMNTNPNYMIGEPALIAGADAFCRGLVPADVRQDLYDAMKYAALDAPDNAERFSLGYYPGDPAVTLEHSLADFAFALVAHQRGQASDEARAVERSGDWQNVFDDSIGFMRPRDGAGVWKDPYLPEEPDDFKEGTGWQYEWLVPHDVRGLFTKIGDPAQGRLGDATVDQMLDEFFAFPATAGAPVVMPEAQQKVSLYGIAYAGNQYAPSNEHDLQAPYMYDWLGKPWKTQAIMRSYQSLFRPAPDGLPGNDDLGSMSAWLIWADLGFYPAIGGAPVYLTGSPLFSHATIRTGTGTVEVSAPGASAAAKYVTSLKVNNAAADQPWLMNNALQPGSTIDFTMSAVPDLAWGSSPAVAPPSMSTGGLDAFGCA